MMACVHSAERTSAEDVNAPRGRTSNSEHSHSLVLAEHSIWRRNRGHKLNFRRKEVHDQRPTNTEARPGRVLITRGRILATMETVFQQVSVLFSGNTTVVVWNVGPPASGRKGEVRVREG